LIVVVIVVVVAIVVVVFVVVVLENEKKEMKNRYLHGTELRSKHATDFVPWYWYVEPQKSIP
jgi:heme/copper-type cytochrome/quinol oxidase subunit 2